FHLNELDGAAPAPGTKRLDGVAAGVQLASRRLGDTVFHSNGHGSGLLAEIPARQDPPAAADHVKTAFAILREVGARNEVAKTLVAQARLERAAGRDAEGRHLQEQALLLFETLGTLNGMLRARATLAVLDGRGRRLLIVSRDLGGLYCELARDL